MSRFHFKTQPLSYRFDCDRAKSSRGALRPTCCWRLRARRPFNCKQALRCRRSPRWHAAAGEPRRELGANPVGRPTSVCSLSAEDKNGRGKTLTTNQSIKTDTLCVSMTYYYDRNLRDRKPPSWPHSQWDQIGGHYRARRANNVCVLEHARAHLPRESPSGCSNWAGEK